MNGDDVGIKEKVILDLIAQCLKPDMEFNSEAIKNCLRMLMEDEVPARSIMRTAILAALSNGDVKRYVLGTIIPGLVKKAIWQGAPKIWEGIIVAVKKLGTSGSANSELTLRALLGAPSPQFKMLLKEDAKSSADVQQLKATLKKLLKSLSPAETEEVISGKWAGLTDSTTTDSTKRKMIDDLIAIEG